MEAELTEASKINAKTDNSEVTEEANVDEAITTEAKARSRMEIFLKNNKRNKNIKNNEHLY